MNKLTEAQKRYIEKLQPGQRATGFVKSFQDFGAFVSIGLVSGLLHNKNIRWGSVDHPEHYLRLGQKIEVVILEVDKTKHRVAFGHKQLKEDPWDKFNERYKSGDTISGSVIKILPFGVLFEIVNGISGLLHKNDMLPGEEPASYSVDDAYEMKILSIDKEARKISLSMR